MVRTGREYTYLDGQRIAQLSGEIGWNGRHNQDHGDFDSHNRQEWNPAGINEKHSTIR